MDSGNGIPCTNLDCQKDSKFTEKSNVVATLDIVDIDDVVGDIESKMKLADRTLTFDDKKVSAASVGNATEEKLAITDTEKPCFSVDVVPVSNNKKPFGDDNSSTSLNNSGALKSTMVHGKDSSLRVYSRSSASADMNGLNRATTNNTESSTIVDNLGPEVHPKGDSIPKVLKYYTRHENGSIKADKNSISLEDFNDSTQTRTKLKFANEINGKIVSSNYVSENNLSSINDIVPSVCGALLSYPKKKLLVLDLNGLLADVTDNKRYIHKQHKIVSGKLVFKRPYCDDFLKFCFERFDIGVWSSRMEHNVKPVVDYLMGNLKYRLKFCWGQSKCTDTGFKTIDNKYKPLFLKELKKLWNKESDELKWEKTDYSPLNTLLIDDSPYKAICNPLHSTIFPSAYHVDDEKDNSLGQGGDIRTYLEGLLIADSVQVYVRENPFGQIAITEAHPSWNFYAQIINNIKKSASSPVNFVTA